MHPAFKIQNKTNDTVKTIQVYQQLIVVLYLQSNISLITLGFINLKLKRLHEAIAASATGHVTDK